MVEKISSAYSDDGQRHRLHRVDDLNINSQNLEVIEPDTGVSIKAEAELSDHRHLMMAERPNEDEHAIYEQDNESENQTSPPGSIGDKHDIMSENIVAKNFRKLGKGYNKPYTVKQNDGSQDGNSVSQEAHKSEATKVSAIAAVSPPVAVPDTSRSIQTFSLQYDKLFAEFKEELRMEYAQMRGCYMDEYQGNYDQNSYRKDERITEMKLVIQSQCDYIAELQGIQDQKEALMRMFFMMKVRNYYQRRAWKSIRYYIETNRRNKFYAARLAKKTRLRRLQALFDAIRNSSHQKFMARMPEIENRFRAELESKILIQYRNKVDSMLLYAAELEDKIKMEQDAREKMTRLYDQSLTQGFQVLQQETQCLASEPLDGEQMIRRD